ncbi:MAG TPA: hypothetical protein VLA00_12805 [Xanthobacteraceae bacterium]|nr:hypothetical protein [Xanthobacteraceae bacterium]
MNTERTEFCPLPIRIRIGHEDIVVRSLDCAIGLIQSLRHDRLGSHAEMLLAQLNAARTDTQQVEAWVAFRTWVTACGLVSGAQHFSQAA